MCVLLLLVHCVALEESHGLKLSPRLMRELWPAVEQVLQRRVRRTSEDLKRLAAAEIDKAALTVNSSLAYTLLFGYLKMARLNVRPSDSATFPCLRSWMLQDVCVVSGWGYCRPRIVFQLFPLLM